MREVIDEPLVGELPTHTEPAAALLIDVIRAFLIDGSDRVDQVLQAAAERDFPRLARGALELQNTAEHLGALELHGTCERLCAAGRQQAAGGLRELSAALKHDFEEAFGILEDLLENYE